RCGVGGYLCFLGIRSKGLPQFSHPQEDPGLDGAERRPETRRDLRMREALEEGKLDALALLGAELGERLAHAAAALVLLHRGDGARPLGERRLALRRRV